MLTLLTGLPDFGKNFKVTLTIEQYELNAENDMEMMNVGCWHTLRGAHGFPWRHTGRVWC